MKLDILAKEVEYKRQKLRAHGCTKALRDKKSEYRVLYKKLEDKHTEEDIAAETEEEDLEEVGQNTWIRGSSVAAPGPEWFATLDNSDGFSQHGNRWG